MQSLPLLHTLCISSGPYLNHIQLLSVSLNFLLNIFSCCCWYFLCSAAAQSADAAQTGAGQKSSREPAPGRRKEESRQPVKKPKEKENALSQFDLNNYASESPKSCLVALLSLEPSNLDVLRCCAVAHCTLYLINLGVVIIDDHPEVTTLEDPQSNTNDDGFTEVVSRKQQKRLQDEERRKKEEQTVQVCIIWVNGCTLL